MRERALFDINARIFRHSKGYGSFLNLNNGSMDATGGHDFLILFEAFDESLVLLLLFLLRTDNKKVKYC